MWANGGVVFPNEASPLASTFIFYNIVDIHSEVVLQVDAISIEKARPDQGFGRHRVRWRSWDLHQFMSKLHNHRRLQDKADPARTHVDR
jgi:hypothetical protein